MTEPWIKNKQRILLVVLSEVVTSVFTLSSSSAEHPMIFSAVSLKTESQASPEGSETFTTIIYLYRHDWTLGSVRANACMLASLSSRLYIVTLRSTDHRSSGMIHTSTQSQQLR